MNFTQKDIIKAIKRIDENPGIVTGRHSSTYDLIYQNRKYPPILVLSIANEIKGGNELTLSDFGNNVDVPFKILRDNGLEIKLKNETMKLDLKEFIKVANEQKTGRGTTEAASLYARKNKGVKEGLKIEISFGVGRASAIPWIAFIGFKQTVKNGIYPVYLYYKDFSTLILAYGVSETSSPLRNWNSLNSKQTIKEYFIKKNSKTPNRYGASYIYKIYNPNSLPSDKTLESDLEQIINEYKDLFTNQKEINKPLKSLPQETFSIDRFQDKLSNSGLIYSNQLIKRFTASLLTKPFIILTGLSGSGKTKLAQAFVQWICQDESQYRIIPVGADWTNREPLLGYPNALQPEEYVKPDSGVLDLIMQANNHPVLPHFLILDEMNLSHVERYFADFLSVMESGEEIPLYSEGTVNNGVPSKLTMPSNLFIIGTVNIDETTHMFSPKVLDRANTIEFRVSQEEMQNFLGNIRKIDMKQLEGKGAAMGNSFLDMAANKSFETKDIDEINESLINFFGELKKTGAEFGYRSATEILRLLNQLSTIDNKLTTNEKIDIAIMQKLLPKLHGSRRKLCPVLETLGAFCISGDVKIIKDVFEKDDFDFNGTNVLYPLSLEKITRMHKGAVDNGFASFAEA